MLVNGRLCLYVVVLFYLFLYALSFLAVLLLLNCVSVTHCSLFVFCVSAWRVSLFHVGLLNSSIFSS
jgi:hypothetical protein